MHYASFQLGWVSLAVIGLVTLLIMLEVFRKRRGLHRLAQAGSLKPLLLVSRFRQGLRAGLLLAAAGLLSFSILGPQWGTIRNEVPDRSARGRDLLLVLDVSRSMLAEDVQPNRLARARADVHDLVISLEKHGGYRVGLIAFADRAAILCPLTSDFRCVQEELHRASLRSLRLVSDVADEGTQIGFALQRAARSIKPEAAPWTDVLLLSDGGDMEPDTLAAAGELSRLGVPIHCIGLGNPTQEALIPIIQPNGTRTYLHYQGEPVRTRLEEEVLRRIAQETGGQYAAVGTGFLELDRWFDSIIAAKTSRELPAQGARLTHVHRFQLFLGVALLLLFLHLILPDRPGSVAPLRQQLRYFLWLGQRRRRWHGGRNLRADPDQNLPTGQPHPSVAARESQGPIANTKRTTP